MNRKRMTLVLIALAARAVCAVEPAKPPDVELPAFPGAEGFGAHTPGERGGKVIIVTNMAGDAKHVRSRLTGNHGQE